MAAFIDTTTEYEIMMPNQDCIETRIKSLHRGEAYKYIGITTALNRNRTDSQKSLQKICSTFKVALHKAKITHEETSITLNVVFFQKYYVNYHVII